MDNYVINNNLLCFTQDEKNTSDLIIIEKDRKFTIKGSCLRFLKKCCYCYGHSYNLQRQFVIDNFNYYIKTPIILSEYKNIILFPTASPNSKKCIWIAYNNIDRYVKEDNDHTSIYFKGGQIFKVNVPYTTIDNQITKCIKIEKLLNNLKYDKVY